MAKYNAESSAAPGLIHCTVVTPERTLLDQQVEFVSVPMYDGELGILPGHSPVVGRLGFGLLRTKATGVSSRYFVDGGFVQVRGNVVTVLTPHAVVASEIELESAMKSLEEARELKARNESEMVEKSRKMARARALIRVAESRG